MSQIKNTDSGSNHQPQSWRSLVLRFSNDRACLAAFLALETAEILEQKKPANLVNLVNRDQACGRNLYRLWKEHGLAILEGSGLAVRVMADRGSSLLLMFYRPSDLEVLLQTKAARVFLTRCGYPNLEDLDASLDHLASRVSSDSFPHEVGIFLGYPFKDVAGFLGWAPLPYTCQGPWKIYGNPTRSLELAQVHRDCRERMARRISACSNPFKYLKAA